MTSIKLISWNVNGIRAVFKKGLLDFINSESPDVLCLQETKISTDLVGDFSFENYPYVYWNCAEKKGYSSTAILSKTEPLSIRKGLGIEKHDKEGRVITAEFADYFLVTVYTPNSQNHDENKRPRRLDYRTKEWDVDFLAYVKGLEKIKPVVFCGDLSPIRRLIERTRALLTKSGPVSTPSSRPALSTAFATSTPIPPNAIHGGPTVPPRVSVISDGASITFASLKE